MSDNTTANMSPITSTMEHKKLWSNCERADAFDKVLDILKEQIPRDVATVGTLVRKAPYFLTSLVSLTRYTWYMNISYDKTKARFVTSISCPEGKWKIVLLHRLSDGVKFDNTIDVLDAAFSHDKWLPQAVRWAKYLLINDKGRGFIFEKTYSASTNREYNWKCRLPRASLFLRVKWWLSDLFRRTSDGTIVKGWVLNCTPASR